MADIPISQVQTDASTGLEVSPEPSGRRPAQRVLGRVLGWGSLVLAIVVGVLVYLRSEQYPVSNLAVLDAPVIGIASRVGGPIARLEVQDNQWVQAGEVLFVIDEAPYMIAVAVAAANLQALQGDLANIGREIEAQKQLVVAAVAVLEQARTHFQETRETYDRLEPLLKPRYASPEQVDTARRAMESARFGVQAAEAELAAARAGVLDPTPVQARVLEAEALLAEAELALSDCTVRAPFDCRVVGLNLAKGAFVQPGIQVMMLLDTEHWHVRADFAEGVLRHIQPGQKARIQLMSAPGVMFEGEVESVGWAVTGMPELPVVTVPYIRREVDWVRLTQRFPVRIRISTTEVPQEFLRSGVTAAVTILTDSKSR